MLYDVIVLGATFTAAGISASLGDKCLVLESRPQAGYEFLNALSFGTDYDIHVQTDQANRLAEEFHARGVFAGGIPCLFPCAPALYKLLQDKPVLLNMQILSVEHDADAFTVTAHGVSGYRHFRAKAVVDTRTPKEQIRSRTLNLLLSCPDGQLPALEGGIIAQPTAIPTEFILKCPMPPACDYLQARTAIAALIRQLPDGFKVNLVADCFDDVLAAPRPSQKGVQLLPSKQFANPLRAFDAGVLFAQGGVL